MEHKINFVKVFSVTKARERHDLGERITAWIQQNPEVKIVNTVVAQTSDQSYHCLSMVLLCAAGAL
jgi:hypothetical protein